MKRASEDATGPESGLRARVAARAPEGLCLLANDAVLHQLVALLNSLERNADRERPVLVIPFDAAVEGVARELARRPYAQLLDAPEVLATWDAFAAAARDDPAAHAIWERKFGRPGLHRAGFYRCLAAFDAPFERFLYLDADMLVLDSLAPFFDALETCELAVFDDQYRAPQHVFDLASPRLDALFGDRVREEVFCTGLFAARRGVLDAERRAAVLAGLRGGDAEVLYLWSADQTLLNYAALKTGIRTRNLYRERADAERVHTCVSKPDLVVRDGLVHDGGRRLPFLHYIGIPSTAVNAACEGRNLVFPYRDLLLDYRYLRDPEARPALRGRPRPFFRPPGRARRLWRKARARLARLGRGPAAATGAPSRENRTP